MWLYAACTSYRRPGVNQQPWTDILCEHLASLGSCKWLAGGDFNGPPLEDPLLLYGHSLHANITYPHNNREHDDDIENGEYPEPIPTRWGGNHCIDYSLQHGLNAPVDLRQERYGDHKLLEYKLDQEIQMNPERCFIPQPRWSRPEHLSPDDWQHQLNQLWATQRITWPPTNDSLEINQIWHQLMTALSNTYRRAHQQAYAGREDRPKQHTKQAKGTDP